MNTHNNKTDVRRHTLAIDAWENEGGAPARDSMDSHYGRRVEADGSWSIYHVFTGVLADIGSRSLTGLTRSGSGEVMMSLNRRNEERRRQQDRLMTAWGARHWEVDEVRS
jgi:hypothetical protein